LEKSTAAWNSPSPSRPPRGTRRPRRLVHALAIVLALSGSLNPVKFGGSVMYLWSMVMRVDLLAPASYPAWNFWISDVRRPPMNPM
jgi:hypothetical protein